jgi:hypothetical protein
LFNFLGESVTPSPVSIYMYLLQVKAPDESKDKWDVFKVTATIPAEQAFRPLDQGGCPLVSKRNR